MDNPFKLTSHSHSQCHGRAEKTRPLRIVPVVLLRLLLEFISLLQRMCPTEGARGAIREIIGAVTLRNMVESKVNNAVTYIT
jgi:hypothetical protein